MKKWGLLFTILFFAGLVFVHKIESSISIVQGIAEPTWNTKSETITTEHIYQGNLVLVNRDYHIQGSSGQEDVINLFDESFNQFFGLLDSDICLSREIALKFEDMLKAANEDGIHNFIISSGYRSEEEQSQLFAEMGAAFALPPGHSEHNLGLSLDVGSTEMKMSEAEEGKWIENHAWEHGFVLRYPQDKTEITGIQYEPWHIRYVGLPHSAIMKEKNFVLEEYLEFLKEEKTVSAEIFGVEYHIAYYPISESTTIQVPTDRHYEISGNNIDGVIVTVY